MLHCSLCILIVRIKSEPIVVPRYGGNSLTTRHSYHSWPIKMIEVTKHEVNLTMVATANACVINPGLVKRRYDINL
jgi:hypothetical protein